MKIRAILTDLDGTLLQPDGSALPEIRTALAAAHRAGIPVCPVTSKTVPELLALRRELGLADPAGFENGAGVLERDGRCLLGDRAVPYDDLLGSLEFVRRRSGAPVSGLHELDDLELAALTKLPIEALWAVRERRATLPLVVDPAWDDGLVAALPEQPATRLVRGNRFLHFQGRHDKADVVGMLLNRVTGRTGLVVALGDAPNDAGLLAAAEVAVIIPNAKGPHPDLVARFPNARVAPRPHGRGWADIVLEMMEQVG